MKIRLISHASVILESSAGGIWTDPWLNGRAFNDSWSLFPEPVFDESLYDKIDYIFISHEHPDHFHVPTLRSLPAEFKERVTILYQANNSQKMFDAFRKFGFKNMIPLPHRQTVSLKNGARCYCYQVGLMDSCFALLDEGQIVLNVNDAEINRRDSRIIGKDIGAVDLVLNQFSIAGYSGFQDYENYLPQSAARTLEKVIRNHRELRAKVTLPFASFIYFSCEDNKYINDFANKPQDVYKLFEQNKEKAVVLFPGDSYEVGEPHDSSRALMRFDELYANFDRLSYYSAESVPLTQIAETFDKLAAHLHDKYPKFILRRLRPVCVSVPDLTKKIVFSIADSRFEEAAEGAEADLIVNSQPLYFGFAFPYGIQTLGVSARYVLVNNFDNWKKHRILLSLNNAEMYLRPKYFFTRANLVYLTKRMRGAASQLMSRLRIMKTN